MMQLQKLLTQDEPEEDEPKEEEEEEEEVDELTAIYNREIEECFAIFDKNKTAMIDTKYAEKALEALGIHLSFLELEEVIDSIDTEGVVFFDQFQPLALEKMQELDSYEALREAFQVFDPDSEGIVYTDRLKRPLITMGDTMPEKEAKELIKLGDPANRGFIQYDILVRTLLA